MTLELSAYRALVDLDVPFEPDLAAAPADPAPDPAERRCLAAWLTTRPPAPPLGAGVHARLERLLAAEAAARPAVDVMALPTVTGAIALWRGDITTLAADAIVNAANDALLGCFQPFHACIDNAIHAAAGPHLREDCDRIMRLQGHAEPTGTAKITRGYHLPARFVLHMVGPIHHGEGPPDRDALAASYRACLDLAASVGGIRSVAFCCISTGVFGFPARPAAEVAIATVEDWLAANPGKLDRVVFNVFSERDEALYEELLHETHEAPAR